MVPACHVQIAQSFLVVAKNTLKHPKQGAGWWQMDLASVSWEEFKGCGQETLVSESRAAPSARQVRAERTGGSSHRPNFSPVLEEHGSLRRACLLGPLSSPALLTEGSRVTAFGSAASG